VINRIRDIRKQKSLTLADVAERCSPPTTAQTIGRLETGMRQLSLTWMNRIAAALEVEPELLVRSAHSETPAYIARFTEHGAEALPTPRDAILPSDLGGDAPLVALAIEHGAGDYRAGDQVWLRQHGTEQFSRLLNRDVLAPVRAGASPLAE
jgi:transcriptional regulator with XRE-family HTH domain